MLRNVILSLSVALLTSIIAFGSFLTIDIFLNGYHKAAKEWHDPNTKFDSELGWSPILSRCINSEWGMISSNSYGFRSKEILPDKKHIILLGDSVTWGYGVGDEETAAYFLEERLKDLNYQVDNLGVSGYGLDQYYLYLKRHIARIPKVEKVILIICTINDTWDTQLNTAYGKRKPLFHYGATGLEAPSGGINKFCLRNIIAISPFLQKVSKRYPPLERLFARLAGDETLSEKEIDLVLKALIDKTANLTKQYGAEFLIVLSPSVPELKGYMKGSDRKNSEWFKKLCDSRQYPCLDFAKVIKGSTTNQSDPREYYYDNFHYNKRGNSLLAETIDTYFKMHKRR